MAVMFLGTYKYAFRSAKILFVHRALFQSYAIPVRAYERPHERYLPWSLERSL